MTPEKDPTLIREWAIIKVCTENLFSYNIIDRAVVLVLTISTAFEHEGGRPYYRQSTPLNVFLIAARSY